MKKALLVSLLLISNILYSQYKYKLELDLSYNYSIPTTYTTILTCFSQVSGTGSSISIPLNNNFSSNHFQIEKIFTTTFEIKSFILTVYKSSQGNSSSLYSNTISMGCGYYPYTPMPINGGINTNEIVVNTFKFYNPQSFLTLNTTLNDALPICLEQHIDYAYICDVGMGIAVEYKIGTYGNWRELIPYHNISQPNFYISIDDFPGLQVYQTFYLRLRYLANSSTDPNAYSDILPLKFIPCPPSLLNDPPTVTDANCYGGNGSITLNFDRDLYPQSGTFSAEKLLINIYNANDDLFVLSYQITDLNTDLSYTYENLPIGSYYIKYTSIIQNNGINQPVETIQTNTFTISNPPELITSYSSKQDVTCHGGNNGSITLNISGGSPGASPHQYQYSFTDNDDYADFTSSAGDLYTIGNLTAGQYNSIYVKDAHGCLSTINNSNIEITDLPAISISNNNSDVGINTFIGDAPGYGLYGLISVLVSGGTENYTYQWYDIDDNEVNDYMVVENSDNEHRCKLYATAGSYYLIVKDSNGCQTKSDNFVIGEPSELELSVVENSGISCNTEQDAILIATASGGVGSYTFTWTIPNGVNNPVITNSGDTSTLINAYQGTYYCNVTDGNGITLGFYSFNTSTLNNELINETPVEFILSSPQELLVTIDEEQSTSMLNCNGNTDGTLIYSISGGTPPYNIQVTNGTETINTITGTSDTSFELPNLATGTYHIDVNDSHGCNTSTNPDFFINEPDIIAISIDEDNSTPMLACHGNNDGELIFSVSGGTAPYNVQIVDDIGDLINTITGLNENEIYTQTDLTSGSYDLIVTYSNSCINTIEDIYTINEPPAITLNVEFTNSCGSESNGTIDITVSGGTPLPTAPYYTYSWTKENSLDTWTTEDLTNVSAGTYIVTVKDANSCEIISDSIVIIEYPELNVTINGDVTNVLCYGASTGAIDITASGGSVTGTYTYLWTKENSTETWTTEDISNVSAGTYSVAVRDANSCEATLSDIIITEPVTPISITSNVTDIDCFGNSTGSIDITVLGGTPFNTAPFYTFQWTKNNSTDTWTTEDLTDVSAGTYTVTVTDANNCSVSNTYILQQPEELTLISTVTDVLCYGESTGGIDITVSGGTPFNTAPFYTFQWTKENSTDTWTTEDLTNVSAGTYSVIIRDSHNCEFSIDITIIEPSSPLSANITNITNVNCYGNYTGSIDITVSGGTAPYAYLWNNDNTLTSEDLTNIPSGTYSVSISDANGCTYSISGIIISQPDASLNISDISTTPVSGYGLQNGQINFTTTGGTPNYQYQWTGSNGFTSIAQPPLSNLFAGEYFAKITDDNGCVFTNNDPFVITEPDPLILELVQKDYIECYGTNSASITSNVSGGMGSYTYSWIGPNGYTSSDQNIYLLYAGFYQLTVTDGYNNSTTQTIEIINENTEITVNATIYNTCYGLNNGYIDITNISGGVPPYNILWSTGAITEDINNLDSGITYLLTITDNINCSKEFSFFVDQWSELSINDIQITNPSGYGMTNGSIQVSVSGGTTPFSYQWFDSFNNLIIGQSDEILSNVGAGEYNLIVTDKNNCSVSNTYILQQPEQLQVSVSFNEITCFGGTTDLTANVSGGISPYSYQWMDIQGNLIGNQISLIDQPAGTYQLTVTDSNNIVIKLSDILISQPDLLTASVVSVNPVKCFGGETGAIDINVEGGTPPYNYYWSNESDTQDLQDIVAGIYNVNILDAKGCPLSLSGIQISQPDEISYSGVVLNQPTGYGLSDGSIEISIIGGIAPYSYQWYSQNNPISGAVNDSLYNLAEGQYTLMVTDQSGCNWENTFTLGQPNPLTVNISILQGILCNGTDTAILQAQSSGGVGGNTFIWYNAITNQPISISSSITNISGIPAGSYYTIVTDANGIYTQSNTLTVTEPEAIQISYTSTNLSCSGGNNGSISLHLSGGSAIYQYRYKFNTNPYSDWTNTNANFSLDNLLAGIYEFQFRDSNLCYFSENGSVTSIILTITEPEILQIQNSVLINPSGYGLSNGNITVNISGGTTPYTFQWFDEQNNSINNQSSSTLSNVSAGTYHLIVTDSNFCTINQSFVLTQPQVLTGTIQQLTLILCSGGSATLKAVSQGGVAPYTYQWYEVDTNNLLSNSNILNNVLAGNYKVVIKDANLNTTTIFYTLTQPDVLTSEYSYGYTGCGTENDWNIELNVQGGTPPYRFDWNTGDNTNTISNVPIGTYMAVISDAHACHTTQIINITPPQYLTVTPQITQLNCYGICDGAINLNISGGVAPYNIEWENGSHDTSLTDLCEGTYKVNISDQKGCMKSLDFTLQEPNPFTLNLGEDITLCREQTADFDININDVGAIYHWQSNNGFNSDNAQVSLTESGIYTATITTGLGCVASDEIIIETSSELVNSEFLVATQAFAKEEIIIVNTSDTPNADIEWILPPEAQIVEMNTNYVKIIIQNSGWYDITLRTHLGECSEDYSKSFFVEEARDLPETEQGNSPFILDFIISPNPNTGSFEAIVHLAEVGEISLRLYSLISNTAIQDDILTGLSYYTKSYQINVSSGVYFLLLETQNGSEIRKIIVN